MPDINSGERYLCNMFCHIAIHMRDEIVLRVGSTVAVAQSNSAYTPLVAAKIENSVNSACPEGD